jgi:hypothetical protein
MSSPVSASKMVLCIVCDDRMVVLNVQICCPVVAPNVKSNNLEIQVWKKHGMGVMHAHHHTRSLQQDSCMLLSTYGRTRASCKRRLFLGWLWLGGQHDRESMILMLKLRSRVRNICNLKVGLTFNHAKSPRKKMATDCSSNETCDA